MKGGTPAGRGQCSPIERLAEVVAMLMKQQRTELDLMHAMGIKSRGGTSRYLRALKAEGLIYVSDWRRPSSGRGSVMPVYAWQPSVCAMHDAPYPVKVSA